MISGSAGPNKPGASYANRFGPMTTLSFLQIDENEVFGAKDGMVPIRSSARGDELRRTFAQSEFTRKFEDGRQVLQNRLTQRGITPLFPRQLAGPLADPIVGSHRNTEEGFKLKRRVDIESIRLDYLAKKAGSRLMFAAYTQALGAAGEANRYLTINEYCAIVADAFMADPAKMVTWHMMGSGFLTDAEKADLRAGEKDSSALAQPSIEEMSADIRTLARIVGCAKLVGSKKKLQWRIDLANDLNDGAYSLSRPIYSALGVAIVQDPKTTVANFLDTAVLGLKDQLDEEAVLQGDRSLAEFEIQPLHPKDDRDNDTPLKVRF